MTADSNDVPPGFAQSTIDAGAVLQVDGEQIVSEVESRLSDPSWGGSRSDGWLLDGAPLLARGDAGIVPLSWTPPQSPATAYERQLLGERSTALWSQVRGACEYRHGAQIGIDLSPEREAPDSYAAELVRTGARRADWWSSGSWAVVLVVYGAPIPEPKTASAVHIVPKSWVWDAVARDEATANDLQTGDLSWSWADVVALADSR